jgi:hypothetical protein
VAATSRIKHGVHGFPSRSTNRASYNLDRPMSFIRRLFGLLAFMALSLVTAAAAPMDAPTADFAKRIFALTGPSSPVTLTFRNVSSLDPDQVRVVRTAIETQLRALGTKFVENSPQATLVRVTLSENTRGWLWIAEVTQGSSQRVVMLSVPGGERDLARRGSMSLREELLFTSDDPILDVLHVNSGTANLLIALSPSEVIVYQSNGAGWTQQQKAKIERTAVMPRDPRGHLVTASDHLFDIYLPGSVCSSNASLPITLTCRDADDLWPLGGQNAFFNSSRNFFTGLLRPGLPGPVSPFFSLASIPIADRTMWIFAGVDGQVRWSDGAAEQLLGGTSDWGSDIASLRSGCGAGTQVIAASKGDSSGADSLRAYEILNRQAAPSSVPLAFNGTITSMWTQVPEGRVTAAIQTAKGSYEAYGISLSCN